MAHQPPTRKRRHDDDDDDGDGDGDGDDYRRAGRPPPLFFQDGRSATPPLSFHKTRYQDGTAEDAAAAPPPPPSESHRQRPRTFHDASSNDLHRRRSATNNQAMVADSISRYAAASKTRRPNRPSNGDRFNTTHYRHNVDAVDDDVDDDVDDESPGQDNNAHDYYYNRDYHRDHNRDREYDDYRRKGHHRDDRQQYSRGDPTTDRRRDKFGDTRRIAATRLPHEDDWRRPVGGAGDSSSREGESGRFRNMSKYESRYDSLDRREDYRYPKSERGLFPRTKKYQSDDYHQDPAEKAEDPSPSLTPPSDRKKNYAAADPSGKCGASKYDRRSLGDEQFGKEGSAVRAVEGEDHRSYERSSRAAGPLSTSSRAASQNQNQSYIIRGEERRRSSSSRSLVSGRGEDLRGMSSAGGQIQRGMGLGFRRMREEEGCFGGEEEEEDENLGLGGTSMDVRARRRRELELLRQREDNENDEDDDESTRPFDEERKRKAVLAKQLLEHRAALSKHSKPQVANDDEDAEDHMSISSEEGDNEAAELIDQETALMQQMMGITDFSTTKGKAHADTDLSGVAKKTKRRYRQYMNRKGGFNRPLSPVF